MKDEEKCIDFIIQNSETVLNHKEAKEFLKIYMIKIKGFKIKDFNDFKKAWDKI